MKALINEIREYLNQELEIVKTQSKLEVANYINDSFNSTEKDSKSVHVLNDRLSIQLSKLRKFTTITEVKMSNFKEFKQAIQTQFQSMCEYKLFNTQTTKTEIWDLYLSSFPDGTNKIYKERREFDCQCCKQFIRQVGNVVAVLPEQLKLYFRRKTCFRKQQKLN